MRRIPATHDTTDTLAATGAPDRRSFRRLVRARFAYEDLRGRPERYDDLVLARDELDSARADVRAMRHLHTTVTG